MEDGKEKIIYTFWKIIFFIVYISFLKNYDPTLNQIYNKELRLGTRGKK